jgi:hypothetical protein
MRQKYDWSADVAKLKGPVMLVFADQTHYDLFVSPKLVDTVLPFLDGKSAVGSWK